MQAVIIAGGQGTRLRERVGDLPKPLVDIGGRPLLEHQVLLARQFGFSDILLLTGYGARRIEEHCGDGAPVGGCGFATARKRNPWERPARRWRRWTTSIRTFW